MSSFRRMLRLYLENTLEDTLNKLSFAAFKRSTDYLHVSEST